MSQLLGIMQSNNEQISKLGEAVSDGNDAKSCECVSSLCVFSAMLVLVRVQIRKDQFVFFWIVWLLFDIRLVLETVDIHKQSPIGITILLSAGDAHHKIVKVRAFQLNNPLHRQGPDLMQETYLLDGTFKT